MSAGRVAKRLMQHSLHSTGHFRSKGSTGIEVEVNAPLHSLPFLRVAVHLNVTSLRRSLCFGQREEVELNTRRNESRSVTQAVVYLFCAVGRIIQNDSQFLHGNSPEASGKK